jgi:hypothetical protein
MQRMDSNTSTIVTETMTVYTLYYFILKENLVGIQAFNETHLSILHPKHMRQLTLKKDLQDNIMYPVKSMLHFSCMTAYHLTMHFLYMENVYSKNGWWMNLAKLNQEI